MKTTTKKRMAVAAILLALVAIGGGIIYMHDRDERNNNNDKTYASLAWKMDTIDVQRPETPVATALADDNVVTPAQKKTTYAAAGRRKPARRKHTAPATDDHISLVTSATYGGNMPLLPLSSGEAIAETETVVDQPATATKTVTVSKEVTKISVTRSRPWRGTNIAPEVGVNSSAFYNTHSNHMEVLGFHAGAMVNIGLGEHVALQPGALFIMKGNKDERTNFYEGVAVTTTNQLSLNYLEIPLNVVYKFNQVGQARFMIGAGPYVSYLAASTNKLQNNTGFGGTMATGELSGSGSNVKKWDAGGGGFIGCQLPKGLYAKAGLEMGILDLQQNPSDYRHGDNNYTFFLSLGYILGPKGKEY